MLKNFYDNQIIEKNKKQIVDKEINNIQAKIWDIDKKQYEEQQKKVKNIIRNMERKNFEENIYNWNNKKKEELNQMNQNELNINKDILRQAYSLMK